MHVVINRYLSTKLLSFSLTYLHTYTKPKTGMGQTETLGRLSIMTQCFSLSACRMSGMKVGYVG